jgi:hypothetical protein
MEKVNMTLAFHAKKYPDLRVPAIVPSACQLLRDFEAYLLLDMKQEEHEGWTRGRKSQCGSAVPYDAFSFAHMKGSLRGGKDSLRPD